MKSALLSQHPANHATRRLIEEAQLMNLSLAVINPQDCVLCLTQTKHSFDFTLNRISAVEMNEFYSSLLHQKSWGKQVNSLELKLLWRDKVHQLTWLSQNGFKVIDLFAFRGPPQKFSEQLQKFFANNPSDKWMLKMNRGQRGVGVHRINSKAELESWLETLWRIGDQDFIIQPQLALINEWRLSLIGDEFVCVLKRAHSQGKANAHPGQAVEWVKAPPRKLLDLIESFKKAVVFDYLALDVLEDDSGLYINDLNTTMGFEQLEKITGYNIARLILDQSIRASH